ncbi:MAG: BamA/TamA family outer membrane protein [Planctomycetes bacterium]|nr:BamA/TamA family outer membrane protein [Planctomycetota bacterium]
MNGTYPKRAARTRAPRFPAWKKLLALAIFLGILAAARSLSLAQEPSPRETVGDVQIIGNRNIGTDKILTYIKKTRPGSEYKSSDLQADILALTSSNMFRNVRVREERTNDGRVIVYFHIDEHPNLVREIVYKNNNHISEKEIESITRLRKGMPLDPTLNRNACVEIEDYHKSNGRYFAKVTLEEGDKPGDSRVVFNITEGPIVKVRDIRFSGNKELATDARLRTQIDMSRALFGFEAGSLIASKFDPKRVDGDVLKLEEYYKDQGYIHARVTREPIFSQDHRFVDIIYHIHEGQRHRVSDVEIKGNLRAVTMDQAQSILQVKKGEYYSGLLSAADKRNLSDQGGWRGHQEMVTSTVYTIPDQPGLVRVQYEIQEKPASKVGQVFVVVNVVTQDRVIRRVIGLYPGQTLRYPELRIAERDLARLNIFKVDPENGIRPTLTVIDPDGISEFKDIVVNVQETQTGSLMFGAGFNSDSGLQGSIVLNEKNFDLFRFPRSLEDIWEGRAFRGAGQELRIEAVPGTELQRYSITVREPFLFDRPYSLTTSAYYNDRVFNEYTENRTGGRIMLGHQLNKYLTLSGGVRIENVNVSNVAFGAPPAYTSVIGDNFVLGPSVSLTYDTRDSFLRPTEGGVASASFEQVFGSFTFPILNVEASRYFTTFQRPDGSGKHVLALRSQVSWAGSDAPVFERFFAGGFRSLRGFEFRGVSPMVNGFAVGGDFMFLNSLEYQIPVRANDQLYLVGFLDSGTVESNVSIHNYRVSAGVGARIIVPMLGPVPIALDFGFPIVRASGDRTQLFSFWIGLFR